MLLILWFVIKYLNIDTSGRKTGDVEMAERVENTLDSQNINNKFNVKNYLNLVSGGRRGSVVT
ncbi:hypothetical protein Bca101_078635 [Brassica carinata]